MARLSAAQRRRLKPLQFALHERRMFPLHDAVHARVAGGRITQAYRAGTISAREYGWALEALAKAHARFGIGGVKRSNVVHLPKITPGAHSCHACKTRIAGHPVSFHQDGATRHYHQHHAHQRRAA